MIWLTKHSMALLKLKEASDDDDNGDEWRKLVLLLHSPKDESQNRKPREYCETSHGKGDGFIPLNKPLTLCLAINDFIEIDHNRTVKLECAIYLLFRAIRFC